MGRGAGESGFSIVEMVMAITILIIVLVPAANLVDAGSKVSADTRARVTAANLASQALDELRAQALTPSFWTSLQLGTQAAPGSPSLVGATSFTVTDDLEWVGQGQAGSECSGGDNSVQILEASASVAWASETSSPGEVSSTLLAPPSGTFTASGTGAIGVQLFDAAGDAEPGVTVTLVGSGTAAGVTQSQIPGPDGCAFFPYLPLGAYAISASAPSMTSVEEGTAPSYQLQPAESASATLSTASPDQSEQFYFDQPGTLDAAPVLPAGATATVGGLVYSAYNSQLAPSATILFGSGVTSLTPLFPFPDTGSDQGYLPFAGDCTDANPDGVDSQATAFYSSSMWASGPPAPYPVSPGATQAASVQTYPLGLSITNQGTSAVTVTISPTTSYPSGSGYPAVSWSCPSSAPSSYSVPLTGSQASPTAAVGAPLGHFTLTANGSGGSATAYFWEEPDGAHLITASGVASTAAPITLSVP